MTNLSVFQPADIFRIIQTADLADGTKRNYSRAVAAYLENGNQLADAIQLQEFAITLSRSRRAALKAAIKLWSEAMIQRTKSQATPDNINSTNAAIYRFQALQAAISTSKPQGEKAHTWLSKVQVTKLINAVDGKPHRVQRDRLVLALLVGAGLRREEAVNLNFNDIKTQPIQGRDRTVLEIHGKGDKGRVVPVSDKLAGIIDTWRLTTGGYGFVLRSVSKGGKIGRSLSAPALFAIVRRYGNLIGKPELAPHDLRRTYAQIGYESGIAVTQISKLLGHNSIETTQRYLNLDLDLDVTVSDYVPL